MKKIIKEAIEEYQCPGCVNGSNTRCYEKSENLACKAHCAGTFSPLIGMFFLGMPKGFDRIGAYGETKISIFSTLKDGWGYDKFNYPVWKYLDPHGNTLVRGICPRTNYPWIHIFLENCIAEIDCVEITAIDLDEMD